MAHPKMVNPTQLRRTMAALDHIAEMRRQHGDDRLITDRWNAWTANFLQAADPDPTSRPTQPVYINGELADDSAPPLTDPTGDAASANIDDGPPANYVEVFFKASTIILALEQIMAEGTVPTVASEEQQKTATPDDNKITSGTCDVCGRQVTRGEGVKDTDYMHFVEGKVLCGTHRRMRRKPKHANKTIDEFIASYQWIRGPAA